jgi:hypothetical protein
MEDVGGNRELKVQPGVERVMSCDASKVSHCLPTTEHTKTRRQWVRECNAPTLAMQGRVEV